MFQFNLIDLEDIVPSALAISSPFSKLNIQCSADMGLNAIKIDPILNKVTTDIKWYCKLVHEDTET